MSDPVEHDPVGRVASQCTRFHAYLGLAVSDLRAADLDPAERIQVVEAARIAHEAAAHLVAAVGGHSSFTIEPRLSEIPADQHKGRMRT